MRRNYARHIVTGSLRFFSGAVPNEILNGTPRHWAFYECFIVAGGDKAAEELLEMKP